MVKSDLFPGLFRWPAALAILALVGCGGGGGEPAALIPVTTVPSDPTGLWVQGGDGLGLSAYRERMTTISPSMAPPVALADTAPALDVEAGGGVTTTYTLEADVDEHDIVKYDGRVLAVAPSRSGCCYVLEDASAAIPPPDGENADGIWLYSTDPVAGSTQRLAEIRLAPEETVEGLYLTGETLQVLISTAWWGSFGDALTYPGYWQAQEVTLLQYDLSDPANPVATAALFVEGGLVTSRRVGSDIHLVTRHTPEIEGLIAYPQNEADVAINEELLASVTEQDVLPEIRFGDDIISPLSLDDCYRMDAQHPLAAPLPSDPAVTTFLTLSAETGEVVQAACTLEPVSGVYASSSHLNLTYVNHGDTDATFVHQLELTDYAYRGSGVVSGQLYGGGNNDFRISEYRDVLRLVTTIFTDDEEDRFDHVLSTLSASSEAPELNLLASLPEPGGEELGKANEDLYGVRFIGERAYLVTFERVDPLYVIDLSDPAAPVIAGTLEVPGFSDLLHPVSEDLLLGIGQVMVEDRRYAKVELFDISDIANPGSRDAILLGVALDYSFSPAQYNRYAFTYRPGSSADRFTVPYSTGGQTFAGYHYEGRIALMEVRHTDNPTGAALVNTGEILLGPHSDVSGETRVVLDDEAVFVINHGSVYSGLWSNPEAVAKSNP